jgi:hypothetical protein
MTISNPCRLKRWNQTIPTSMAGYAKRVSAKAQSQARAGAVEFFHGGSSWLERKTEVDNRVGTRRCWMLWLFVV